MSKKGRKSSSRKKSGGKRKYGEGELDERSWSDGEGITEMDKRKIGLAVDRFWASRGKLGKRVGEEEVSGR